MPSSKKKSVKIWAKVNRNRPPQKKRRQSRTSQKLELVFHPPRAYSCPLPMIFRTRITASGFCYTGTGTGTGDHIWNLYFNQINQVFSGMVTGLTWNGITPGSYKPAGFDALFKAGMYESCLVEGVLVELDVVNQSIGDSVVVCVTPSSNVSTPATVAAALAQPFTKAMTFSSGRTYRQGDYSFSKYYSMAQYLGMPPYLFNNDISGFWTMTLTQPSPSNLYYLVLNVETGDDSTFVAPLEIRVRLSYDVKFFELTSGALQDPVHPRVTMPHRIKSPLMAFPPGTFEEKIGDLSLSERVIVGGGDQGDPYVAVPTSTCSSL